MASLTEKQKQIGPGPVPVWDMQTASAGQIDACCGLGRGKSILDNGYFAGGGSQQGGGQFPINQRGQTVYSAPGQYSWVPCVDRWLNDGQVSLVEGGLQLTSIGSYGAQMFQRFEQSRVVQGEVYTASMLLANGELVTESGVITFDVQEHQRMFGSDRLYVARDTGTLGVVGTAIGLGQSQVITAMQLELGPVQTLAHKDASGNWVLNVPSPNFALELLKCQRYFVYGNLRGLFYGRDGNAGSVLIPTPVTLRAKPTIVGNMQIAQTNTQGFVATSLEVAEVLQNGVLANYTPGTVDCLICGTFGFDSNL